MACHEFTLQLAGVSELTEDLETRVYEGGCDDALLGVSAGRGFLDFSREADTLVEAVASALRDARKAGLTVERIKLADKSAGVGVAYDLLRLVPDREERDRLLETLAEANAR
jgi:hypothetical protein